MAYTWNPDTVYQMNWSVYFILAVSIASIAWGVVNFFMVSTKPTFKTLTVALAKAFGDSSLRILGDI